MTLARPQVRPPRPVRLLEASFAVNARNALFSGYQVRDRNKR